MQKNTPALTWHQISCKFFACKLSSLGPGAELLPQATEIRPRAGRSPPRSVLTFGHSLRVSFLHCTLSLQQVSFLQVSFPAGRFLQYSFFFLGGFHPGSPLSPLVGRLICTFGALLVEIGSLIFRCVFWACFLMIFDAFFAHFWDDFYMFFAYLFEQCFCLLFPRTFFKCMHTFKTRDLQKTLFFSSKNAILEEPPLQTTYEKMHFLGWNRTLFFA